MCLALSIAPQLAWLVGAAVDLSVVGLLTGVRFLSLHGYSDGQLRKPRRMLLFSGILTLALNISGALSHHRFGTALVDAVGPALLIGWSEVGSWLLRQIYAVCSATPQAAPEPVPDTELLARARQLDAEHRTATGRPISRDTLRAQLRIGRVRAAALIATIRFQPDTARQETPIAA